MTSNGLQVYQIMGIVKSTKRHPGQESSTITVTSVTTQKDYHIFCNFFCPAKRNDVLSGFSIAQKDGTLAFVQCPVVEPASNKDAVQDVFIIGMGNKLRISRYMSDQVYQFFEKEAVRKIKLMESSSKNIDKGSSDSTIFRNRDSLNAAVMETISWYANNFRGDETIAQPLINLGLTKEQAHKLLRSWYRDICLRRLYLLGLTRKEIRECCERGWAGVKGIVNSPDALYYQLLENPYIPEKIPLNKAQEIAIRYGLTFNQDIIECANLIRFIDEQTTESGWSCYPIFSLLKRYPRFNELSDTLKLQFKCTIRYNFLYLRHQAEIEDTLFEYLQSQPLPQTHASEQTMTRLYAEQVSAVELSLNNLVSTITGGAGVGKCVAPDTPILLANGDTRYAKEIVIGDYLIGDDSTIRTVLSICSGEDNMYEIIPSKGRSFICNEPHILTLKGIMPHIETRKDRILQYNVRYSIRGDSKNRAFRTNEESNAFIASLPEDIFDIPLNQYLKMPDRFKRYTYLFHTGVNFFEQPICFDPYIIGLWLGDGNTNSTVITTADEEIVQYLNNKLPEYNLRLSSRFNNGMSYYIGGSGNNYGMQGSNYFINILRYYNLLGNKHIPNVYKLNSRLNRLKLLAGLIDSDGYRGNNCIEISQKSDQLADDIEYLAFSLGFMVTRTKGLKSCMYKGEVSEGFYNKITIFGDGLEQIPVLLERKKCYPRQSKTRATCLSFKVVLMGRGQYCGFTLDGNGRFLLGDFLVTHNTTVISAIVQELELREISYVIGSFTGKAVANIKRIVRRRKNIMTLNMMLSKGKVVDQFDRPIKVLIIDEISMVPNELLAKVILKLNYALNTDERLQVVLVGDPNQVQPIEWGDFCNQMMTSWIFEEGATKGTLAIPWVQLTEDHRRREKGVLFNNMAQFVTAESPEEINFEWGNDCEFVQGGVAEVEAKVRSLHQQGSFSDEVTIISPINEGLEDINLRVQNIFISEHAPNIRDAFGKVWKLGARVMMTENRYDIDIMNGEEGTILGILPEKSSIRIRFQNGQEVDIPTFIPVILEQRNDLEDLDLEKPLSTKLLILSWAITVHKSQGSQWKNVIFYIPKKMGKGSFFNRNLLYTGTSRTEDHLTVIAPYESTFTSAILVNPPHRYDNLAKRFKKEEFVDHYVDSNHKMQQQMLLKALNIIN